MEEDQRKRDNYLGRKRMKGKGTLSVRKKKKKRLRGKELLEEEEDQRELGYQG